MLLSHNMVLRTWNEHKEIKNTSLSFELIIWLTLIKLCFSYSINEILLINSMILSLCCLQR